MMRGHVTIGRCGLTEMMSVSISVSGGQVRGHVTTGRRGLAEGSLCSSHCPLHTAPEEPRRGPGGTRGGGREGGIFTCEYAPLEGCSERTAMQYLAEEVRVANDNQQGLGTANGHIEPFGVTEKPNVVSEVRGHHLGCGTNLGKRGERELGTGGWASHRAEHTVEMMMTSLSCPWNSSTEPTFIPLTPTRSRN